MQYEDVRKKIEVDLKKIAKNIAEIPAYNKFD